MTQNQTGHFPNKWGGGGGWISSGTKRLSQICCKVGGSGRLTFQNRKFLRKFWPPDCKSLSSIPYLRKANTPLQKFVFSGNYDKNDFHVNVDFLRSQKVTIARFAMRNQLHSFHLRTQIAWVQANPLQSREIVYCLVWILIINLGFLKEILLMMVCHQRMNCIVPV